MEQVEKILLGTLHELGGQASKIALCEQTQLTEEEVETGLRGLIRKSYVSNTIDWDYALASTIGERGEQDEPEYSVERSESEIVEKVHEFEQYPYSSGSKATEIRGARRLARWLVGEKESYGVPGVEKQQFVCTNCDWEAELRIHRNREPVFCPDCDGVETIKRDS